MTRTSARVAFQSDREGDLGIFWQRADGSGIAERLTTAGKGVSHVPESWSSKSEQLLFAVTEGASVSLWTFVLKDKKATQVAGVRSTLPLNAGLSRDGRWLVYSAAEAPGPGELGAQRMIVEPFPVRHQVPAGEKHPSGVVARWTRNHVAAAGWSMGRAGNHHATQLCGRSPGAALAWRSGHHRATRPKKPGHHGGWADPRRGRWRTKYRRRLSADSGRCELVRRTEGEGAFEALTGPYASADLDQVRCVTSVSKGDS